MRRRIVAFSVGGAGVLLLLVMAGKLWQDARLIMSAVPIDGYLVESPDPKTLKYSFEVEGLSYTGEDQLNDRPSSRDLVVLYVPTDPSINALDTGDAWKNLFVGAIVAAVAAGAFVVGAKPTVLAESPKPRAYEADSSSILRSPVEVMFRTVVATVGSDGKIGEAERAYLEKLRQKLNLSEEVMGQAIQEAFAKEASMRIPRDAKVRRDLITHLIEAVAADGIISPAEHKKIGSVAAAIGFPIDELQRLMDEAVKPKPKA